MASFSEARIRSDTMLIRISPRVHLDAVRMLRFMSDIKQPSLPTPFYSVLVSISVFMALSTVFHSISPPTILCFLTLFFRSYLYLSTIYHSSKVFFGPDVIHSGWLGSKHQLTNSLTWSEYFAQLRTEEAQTAVVRTCLPFIRSGQSHLARHRERGKKTRQTEKEMERQHQGMDKSEVRQVPEVSGEHRKLRKLVVKSPVMYQRPSRLRDRWSEEVKPYIAAVVWGCSSQ